MNIIWLRFLRSDDSQGWLAGLTGCAGWLAGLGWLVGLASWDYHEYPPPPGFLDILDIA